MSQSDEIVVTGIGLVTPLGVGSGGGEYGSCAPWDNLCAGRSGVVSYKDRSCSMTVQDENGNEVEDQYLHDKVFGSCIYSSYANGFATKDFLSPAEMRRMDVFMQYGTVASDLAFADAKLGECDLELERCGVCIGSGIGGLVAVGSGSIDWFRSVRDFGRVEHRLSPFFIPSCLINLLPGNVAIKHSFRGPNTAPVAACATGAQAIVDGVRMIRSGEADLMLVGGAESTNCPTAHIGFNSMKALSRKFSDCPEKASRPWDKDQDGFVMADGSGVMVIEKLEHAKRRGANIYGKITGYGLTCDAHGVAAPDPECRGQIRAMKQAMSMSGIGPYDIDHINAHSTSTPIGDKLELIAIKGALGDYAYNLPISANKSSIGHTLGAAGSIESAFALLSIRDNIAPPTLNLDNPIEEAAGMNLVPHDSQKIDGMNCVLSNSFGFGGTNCSIIFEKYSDD